MKVLCVVPFYDLRERCDRRKGDVFDISADRYEEIVAVGAYVERQPAQTRKRATTKTKDEAGE